MPKLVYGFGINDAGYRVTSGDRNNREICPYYSAWYSMIARCNSPHYLARSPAYRSCKVDDRWRSFKEFRIWAESQGNAAGNQLDKDILVIGNKVYSPETCVFVPQRINALLLISEPSDRKFPLGVSFDKRRNSYLAQCRSAQRITKYLGAFKEPFDAHRAWQKFKSRVITEVASDYSATDQRVSASLMRIAGFLNDDYSKSQETVDLAGTYRIDGVIKSHVTQGATC